MCAVYDLVKSWIWYALLVWLRQQRKGTMFCSTLLSVCPMLLFHKLLLRDLCSFVICAMLCGYSLACRAKLPLRTNHEAELIYHDKKK